MHSCLNYIAMALWHELSVTIFVTVGDFGMDFAGAPAIFNPPNVGATSCLTMPLDDHIAEVQPPKSRDFVEDVAAVPTKEPATVEEPRMMLLWI